MSAAPQIGKAIEKAAALVEYPDIVSASDLFRNPPPTPVEVIRGIIRRGGKMQYGGPAKTNKTWSLLDLCISVAMGMPWLDFQTVRGRVLYVNFELMPCDLHERLGLICKAKELEAPPPLLDLITLRGCRAMADIDRLTRVVLDHVRGGDPYALIVPDPIYKILNGKDENSAGQVGEMLATIEALATETGAAVAWGAHFAKGNSSNKEPLDRVSGSGVFARDPDACLTATPLETEGEFQLSARLRGFAPVEDFGIRWEFPLMRRCNEINHAALKNLRPGSGKSAQMMEPLIPAAVELVKRSGKMTVSEFRALLVERLKLSDTAQKRLFAFATAENGPLRVTKKVGFQGSQYVVLAADIAEVANIEPAK